MFKMRPVFVFAVNALLLSLSWLFHRFAHGDEYLILFVIPLVCIIAPYALTIRAMIFLLSGNLMFLVFYSMTGILNPVDVVVLMSLFLASSGISYMVMLLGIAFERYNRSRIVTAERKYNHIMRGLEKIERKGRNVEREMARISRLYEITKQLGSVLKFDDLMDTLFDFLKDNFQFETAHLLIFNKGEFSHSVSRGVSGDREYREGAGEAEEHVVDFKVMVNYLREKGFKPFYMERRSDEEIFNRIGVSADTFSAFPLFVKSISAVLAIEGTTRQGYNRFSIIAPQIALELRKVELYEQVEKLSIFDGLTGVYLRRYFMERLEEEVDRARRLDLTFSVGMIDIDHFKECNDRYGHLVGDGVLKEVAERLKLSVREVDMIARYGGEEFCVILPETTKDLALVVAERLRKSVEIGAVKAFDEKINITVSAGIATYPADGKNASSLIEAADTALYKAKRKGRNMVVTA